MSRWNTGERRVELRPAFACRKMCHREDIAQRKQKGEHASLSTNTHETHSFSRAPRTPLDSIIDGERE